MVEFHGRYNSYLSHSPQIIPDELKTEGGLILAHSLMAHSIMVMGQQECEVVGVTAFGVRKAERRMLVLSLVSLFVLMRTPARGWCCPHLKMDLLTSINPV